MLKPRVIPTLLVDGPSIVKGANFDNWRTVGTLPPALNVFSARDVDELVIVDVRASRTREPIDSAILTECFGRCFVPLTIGGGVSDLQTALSLFEAGADKIIVGSASFENPNLIVDIVSVVGSQSVIGAIDVAGADGEWRCLTNGGTVKKTHSPIPSAQRLVDHGVGEVMLTSISRDGTMLGYDLDLIETMRHAIDVPLLASGGAGSSQDMCDVIAEYGADAACAGSLFQFTEVTPADVRQDLFDAGVPVRITVGASGRRLDD